MWVVAKIKDKHSRAFKKDLINKIEEDIIFYEPKIVYEKLLNKKIVKVHKSLLENYIFCFNKKFKDKVFLNKFKFTKGLQFFLDGYINSQDEILEFIDYCKSFEDRDGFITNNFFKNIVSKRAKFVSGPFINMTFEIIEKQKNKIKISIGKFITTMSDNKKYLYRPV